MAGASRIVCPVCVGASYACGDGGEVLGGNSVLHLLAPCARGMRGSESVLRKLPAPGFQVTLWRWHPLPHLDRTRLNLASGRSPDVTAACPWRAKEGTLG